MRLGALIKSDLAKSKRRLMVVAAAVAIGVSVLVLLGGIGTGLYKGVVEPLLPKLPLDLLKVEPRIVSMGIFSFDPSKVGGGLDDRAIDRLSKIEGVRAVYPALGAAFPMRAEGGEGFVGRRIRTDLFATGIAPELVKDDVAKGYSFEAEKNGKVPVLVARRLLDLYNTTVAPSIDKPRLSAEAVIGFEFQLVLGSSYARGTPAPGKVQTKVAQIVGLSDQATLVGITVPEASLRAWNQRFGHAKSPITGAYVKTKRPSDAGPVAHAIEQAGLKVDDTPKVVGATLVIAALVVALFSGTLLLLAAFAIAQTFFLLVGERRMELAVLRALGATRSDLRRLVLLEASAVGALGGFIGVVMGALLALSLDAFALSQIPDIPFKPAQIVLLPPWLLLGSFGLGLLSAVVGAYLPAARAASANPAATLRS